MKRFIRNIYLTLKTIENIHTFIFDYFGFLKKDVIYKIRNKNITFVARAGTSDKDQIVAIMSGFEYPLRILPKLKTPIILDLGAYIGDSTIYINNYFRGKCRILAVEPSLENYKYCRLNLERNKIKATLLNLAVGDKSGKTYLRVLGLNKDAYRVANKGRQTEVITLSKLAEKLPGKKIDILKMDIEGGEYRIFNHKESYAFIKNNVRFIFLEYHYDLGKSYVRDLLSKLEKDFFIMYHRDNLISLENKLLK